MARGPSGRIVLEIDPETKRTLYEAVVRDGLTLKDWFLRSAREYLRSHERVRPDSSRRRSRIQK